MAPTSGFDVQASKVLQYEGICTAPLSLVRAGVPLAWAGPAPRCALRQQTVKHAQTAIAEATVSRGSATLLGVPMSRRRLIGILQDQGTAQGRQVGTRLRGLAFTKHSGPLASRCQVSSCIAGMSTQ